MPTGINPLLASQLAPLVAYIGPGADLALISSTIGLLLTMGSSLIFLVLWPFRSLWRRYRAMGNGVSDESAAGS